MKTKKLLLIAATLLAVACTHQHEALIPEEQPTPALQLSDAELRVLYQMRNKDNRIDLEEAVQLALSVANSADRGTSLTKSNAVRRVGAVKTIRTSKSVRGGIAPKSEGGGNAAATEEEALAYIVNFEDDGGFAIIAADTRTETPILAFCDNGSLGDTITNPGLALFLEGIPYYMERCIAEAEQQRDSLLSEIMDKLWEYGEIDTIRLDAEAITKAVAPVELACDEEAHYYYEYGPWETAERVGPLLPVEWSQGSPYNNNAPSCSSGGSGGKAWAGCVAIAAAQLMAYWRHPAVLDGVSLNWNLLRDYTAIPNRYVGVGTKSIGGWLAEDLYFINQIAYLVGRIGVNIGMQYGCKGSSASTENAMTFLRGKGYTISGSSGYNEATVINSLDQWRPVLITGYAKEIKQKFLGITYNTYYDEGHTWVVDGHLKQRRKVTVTVTAYKPGLPVEAVTLAKSIAKAVAVKPPICIRTTSTSTYYETSSNYLHNNWGQHGSNNGYYVAGSFNYNNAPAVPSNTLAKSSGEQRNYQYNIKIFPNIYK